MHGPAILLSMLLFMQFAPVQAQSSLRGAEPTSSEWTPVGSWEGQQAVHPESEMLLLDEIEEALGSEMRRTTEQDLESIKAQLKPTFDAVPKNEYGNIGHTAVRYTLHRLFVARHGWFIRGLDPKGERYNSSSPAEVLLGKVPLQVQGLFERRLIGRGFGLHGMAVFAAMLENLIHQEALDRVKHLFTIGNIRSSAALPPRRVDFILDLYMAAYIMGLDLLKMTHDEVTANEKGMVEAYPGWADTQKFTREIRARLFGESTSLVLAQTVVVANEVGEKFGRFQNAECVVMKKKLMALEGSEKGCVPTTNFYNGMLQKGDWQFSESPEYLKQLGALDDTDPNNMRVMLPNYINSATNCVASSSYYSVCCIDECVGLLAHIERRVAGPDALPDEIVSIVGGLPSSTVPVNRKLSATQLDRLSSIADKHGGRVQIHGRLFMQWLHNVYPRECPYPHVAGSTNPMSPDAWSLLNKVQDTMATTEQMQQLVKGNASAVSDGGQCGRWNEQDEYYVATQTKFPQSMAELENDTQTWAAVSFIALATALATMTLMMVHSYKSYLSAAAKLQTVQSAKLVYA